VASRWRSPLHHRSTNQRRERTERTAIQMSATTHLNWGLRIFFSELVRVSLRWPSQALFFAPTVLWQGRAARLRARNAAEGLTVPPLPGTMLNSNEKLRASRRCP
jgi:hypothetical protein